MKITKKIKDEMLEILETTYKDAKPALIFNNPFELLIAVILSAQCTDKRVNITTARLFAKANTPEKILEMGVTALEEEIRDCGLFRNKAKNIIGKVIFFKGYTTLHNIILVFLSIKCLAYLFFHVV